MIEERIHATKQYVKALFADRADDSPNSIR